MVDLGLPGRARVHGRDGDPAGDRRPRLAAPPRAPRATRSTARSPPTSPRRSSASSLYTAVKAAYLSTVFSTLTEERNLIYLSPLMLIGTALVLPVEEDRLAARRRGVRRSSLFLVLEQAVPAAATRTSRRPGFAILTIPNRHWRWDVHDLQLLLLGRARAVGSLAARVPPAHGRRRRRRSCSRCAWMLTSRDRDDASASTNFANKLRSQPAGAARLGRPRDRTGSRSPTSARRITRTRTGCCSTEFWNRSLQHVYSLDGSRPAPGRRARPTSSRADGTLSRDAGQPLRPRRQRRRAAGARSSDRRGRAHALPTHRAGPGSCSTRSQQVYSDGWVPDWSTYTYFKPDQRGTLVVTPRRTGFNGDAPPGRGADPRRHGRILPNGHDAGDRQGHVYRRRRLIANGQASRSVDPGRRGRRSASSSTSRRRSARSTSDPRNLGAQVGFKFVPAKQRRADARRPVAAAASASRSRGAAGGRRAARGRCGTGSPGSARRPSYEYFLARLRARADVIAPFAIFVAATAASRSPALAGARRVAAAEDDASATASCTRRASGCCTSSTAALVAAEPAAREPLVARAPRRARRAARSTRSASRRCRSTPSSSARSRRSAGRSSASASIAPWTRRRLVLPGPFEEFVASRSSNTRWRIRRDAKRLVGRARRPAHGRDRPRAVASSSGSSATPTASRASTYQRALGAGLRRHAGAARRWPPSGSSTAGSAATCSTSTPSRSRTGSARSTAARC